MVPWFRLSRIGRIDVEARGKRENLSDEARGNHEFLCEIASDLLHKTSVEPRRNTENITNELRAKYENFKNEQRVNSENCKNEQRTNREKIYLK